MRTNRLLKELSKSRSTKKVFTSAFFPLSQGMGYQKGMNMCVCNRYMNLHAFNVILHLPPQSWIISFSFFKIFLKHRTIHDQGTHPIPPTQVSLRFFPIWVLQLRHSRPRPPSTTAQIAHTSLLHIRHASSSRSSHGTSIPPMDISTSSEDSRRESQS